MAALSLGLWLVGGGVSCAADNPIGQLLNWLVGGEQAQAVVEVAVDPAAGEQFRPVLTQLLGRELHLIRKVCQPDEQQFAKLREAGQAEVTKLGLRIAQARQANRSTESWPRPRTELAAALAAKVSEIMSPEAAARFRTEIEAREAAQRSAAQQMMIVVMDRKLTLLPGQPEALSQALEKDWDDKLSRNMQIYLYEDYLQMPKETAVAQVLNDRQKSLYRRLNRRGTISFGWEQDLGLQWWGDNGAGGDEFGTLGEDRPSPPEEAAPVPAAESAAAPAAAEAGK